MITNEFIAHESGQDSEGQSERRWLRWTDKVEHLAGIDSLDGDQEQDGYSLDFAYQAYRNGCTPEWYALKVREGIKQATGGK